MSDMTTGEVAKASLRRVPPEILVGAGSGNSLPEAAMANLMYVVVDSHLHLPDMFEICFFASPDVVASVTKIEIGTELTIRGQAPGHSDVVDVIMVGEVTAIEAEFTSTRQTVVRGYSVDHRLQRARRTRTFVNMKLSDIARKIAGDAKLPVGTVEQTRTAHAHLGQVNQTDWDFLHGHARAIGYELGVAGGEFFFRKAASAGGAAVPVELVYPDNLRAFRARVTAANLATEAEIRIWDPMAAKVTTAKVPTETGSAALNGNAPKELAALFTSATAGPPKATGNSAAGDLGPPPSETAYVVSDWPLAGGAAAGVASDEGVAGVAEHLGGTFAEAEGEAIGDPRLLAGTVVGVRGVSETFTGRWVVTRTRHVFDEGGYHVHFEVSGRQERSLLGLTSGGSGHRGAPSLPGLVCGVVTNNNDPDKKGRVKLTLPFLSPLYETDWAPVAQAGAGRLSGAMFLPEVGDEVLVGFEFGNPQRAYVLGGVVNDRSTYQLGGPPIKANGATGAVVWRGFVSASGNRLAFHDELADPAGRQPPTASDLVLGTKDGGLSLTIDQTAGTVTLNCAPAPPNSRSAAGAISIACGQAGTIDIKTGQGGAVTIDGGAQLNLKAQAAIKIESQGVVEIKGAQVKLN